MGYLDDRQPLHHTHGPLEAAKVIKWFQQHARLIGGPPLGEQGLLRGGMKGVGAWQLMGGGGAA